MATVTEKDVREWADEWGEIVTRIAADVERAKELENKVKAFLKTSNREQRITGNLAVAAFTITEKYADRVIDVAEFLKTAEEFGRDDEDVMKCLTVEVKKAEFLIGKTKVDEISSRATVTTKKATLELKT